MLLSAWLLGYLLCGWVGFCARRERVFRIWVAGWVAFDLMYMVPFKGNGGEKCCFCYEDDTIVAL